MTEEGALHEGSPQLDETLYLPNTDRTVEFKGNQWKFNAHPLAPPYSTTTHLTHPLSENRFDFWLDWHDMNIPSARMHMYLGENSDPSVSFDTRLTRMERWAEAIQVYDSIMVDPEKRYSKEELETMINNGVLPRPEIVVLDTGTPGLRRLFEVLNLPKESKENIPEDRRQFMPKWNKFVELAKSGEFVSTWRSLKGR